MKQWGAVRCFCTALAFIISITPHTIGVSNILGNTKLDHNVHGKMLLAILRPDWKLTGKGNAGRMLDELCQRFFAAWFTGS